MQPTEQITIEKLVHGGQGLGLLGDGRKCFVWGSLPGETVSAQLTKKKKGYAEAIATEIITANPKRIAPLEPEIYLATSPWQILEYAAEATAKQEILAETFVREHVDIVWQDFYQEPQDFGYRNKMEYNFWFFNESQKVSLALHRRGTHQKVAVAGSALAAEPINAAGEALITFINKNSIEARPLKSVILRSDNAGKVGISLFINDKAVADKFVNFSFPNTIFEIIYSNPKSPASVATEVLVGSDDSLADTLLKREFRYSPRSFFQVNIPIYEAALQEIAGFVECAAVDEIIDLYSGVGSIGLSVVGDKKLLTMIEIDAESTAQAKLNMAGRKNCSVVTATAESALDYITGNELVILDPPRAGLHADVTDKLVEVKPQRIIYLSCNPSTQARDVSALLAAGYSITHARGYNFFPRTPHIESLIVLDK